MIKFGTDGWRGVIADNFTFDNVRIVSQAISDYLIRSSKKNKRVVVGYDRRFLSREFAQAASCVLAANNIKVVLSKEAIPTPIVSFECLYKKYDLGIMITASHNPAQFNGLKIKTKEGAAADKSLTDKIEKLLYKQKPRLISFEAAVKSRLVRIDDISGDYIAFLRNFVDIKKIRRLKLKILMDNMYGVGDSFIERILGASNIKVDYIHNEFNPSFGGIHPEPIEPNLQDTIKKMKQGIYNLGVVLDGDADRIAVIDRNGVLIDAQILLPLLALHMVEDRKEKEGIAKTVVGSKLIDTVALSLGVPCYETAVGFKYISQLFKEKLISIGGEEAGGIGFKGYIPERDGTASFLMILEMIACKKKSFDILLKDLWKKYGRWYYAKTSFPVSQMTRSLDSLRFPSRLLGRKVVRINKSDGIKLIADNSWLMFRKSGTEPIVRVYSEAKSNKEAASLLELGSKLVKRL
ncbi:MAG: phosphoglucomutase/phosphomannomutase family protein [Candidatus Omnitrophota bacterium]